MQIETQRLILRKPEIADVDDYMEFVNTVFVQRYNVMLPATREKVEEEFSGASDDFQITVLETKVNGKVIGIIYTLEDSLRFDVGSKEISYFLREDEAGKGYMKEALLALLQHYFKEEKLTCVTARSFLPNVASQRLLESLGFQREGILRRCVRGYRGEIFDDCLYSVMQEDWQKV